MITLKRHDYHLLMVQMETVKKELEVDDNKCFACSFTSLGTGVDVLRLILGEKMTRLVMTLAYYYRTPKNYVQSSKSLAELKNEKFMVVDCCECISYEFVKEVLDELYKKGIIQIEENDK